MTIPIKRFGNNSSVISLAMQSFWTAMERLDLRVVLYDVYARKDLTFYPTVTGQWEDVYVRAFVLEPCAVSDRHISVKIRVERPADEVRVSWVLVSTLGVRDLEAQALHIHEMAKTVSLQHPGDYAYVKYVPQLHISDFHIIDHNHELGALTVYWRDGALYADLMNDEVIQIVYDIPALNLQVNRQCNLDDDGWQTKTKPLTPEALYFYYNVGQTNAMQPRAAFVRDTDDGVEVWVDYLNLKEWQVVPNARSARAYAVEHAVHEPGLPDSLRYGINTPPPIYPVALNTNPFVELRML